MFPVVGSRLWNSLPDDVTSEPTLVIFRKRCYLFRRSYTSDLQFCLVHTALSGLAVFMLRPL